MVVCLLPIYCLLKKFIQQNEHTRNISSPLSFSLKTSRGILNRGISLSRRSTNISRNLSQLENLQDAKRVPPPKSFPAILARTGQEKYSDLLNFDLGCTTSKGYHILIGCKVCHHLCCHWHPPAGSVSRMRIVVYKDGSFYFQVLLRSKEAGTMETIDHFLSVCKRAVPKCSCHRITCLSRYFPERVCTVLYEIGYSLFYYLLLVISSLVNQTLLPQCWRWNVIKITSTREEGLETIARFSWNVIKWEVTRKACNNLTLACKLNSVIPLVSSEHT